MSDKDKLTVGARKNPDGTYDFSRAAHFEAPGISERMEKEKRAVADRKLESRNEFLKALEGAAPKTLEALMVDVSTASANYELDQNRPQEVLQMQHTLLTGLFHFMKTSGIDLGVYPSTTVRGYKPLPNPPLDVVIEQLEAYEDQLLEGKKSEDRVNIQGHEYPMESVDAAFRALQARITTLLSRNSN